MRRVLAMWTLAVTASVCAASPCAASTAPVLPSADPFYSYGAPVGLVPAGTILRTRTITNVNLGLTTPLSAVQVLYRTTGEQGQATVTVATVIQPPVPLEGSKLVSYQTAYDALGSKCDPSYTLQGGNPSYSQDEQALIGAYVAAGYTVVVPDYEGTGLDWGAGQESGYGTLDGIRAAENLLKLGQASTPVGLIGYSGGSIATEFATELAPSYAPDLDIVGAAEGGIPVDFAHNNLYVNGSHDWSGVIPAVLVSLGRAFGVNIDSYLSPYGLAVTHAVADQCINSFLGAYPGLTYQKLLAPSDQNILAVPAFAGIVDRLIMSGTGTPAGPLFMGVGNADGTGDGVMIAGDVEALAHTYCQRGVSVQLTEYSGDNHFAAAIPFEVGALTFLEARLNGLSVANGCSSIGQGNSLAPLPVLSFRYLGSNRRRRGLVVELSTSTGTLANLVITLNRGARIAATVSVPSVTTAQRRIVVRVRGRFPRAGRYTLTVAQGGTTLALRTVTVRR